MCPIADDWNFDFANKVIEHIDGVLSYDTGSGTQPAVGEYIIGVTSGAVGKVIARTGTVTSGTLTLTNVIGLFDDNEQIDIMSSVDFDGVGNGGFEVGDTIVDQVTGSIDVKFIEYNIDGVAGHGTIYGTNMTAFTNNSQLDISGGQTAVGLADGVGVDNDADLTAQVNTELDPPGTANTNNCVIIHYDAGSIAIPEEAHITDSVSGAEGYAQKIFGTTTAGSIRVIDSDTTGGAWTNNNNLRILDCVYYDNLVAGSVFAEGNVVRGSVSLATGRVIGIIDDGDSTGKLILAGFSGTWNDLDDIQVLQDDDTYVKVAEVENTTNKYLDAATLNLPGGVRTVQREDQGGIYGAGGSLNIVRSSNAFYSYAQDLFDELAQLDDDPALFGVFGDFLYTILNDYVIPDLSFRFLEDGAFQDSAGNNIFTNIQTTGAIADIGDHGYLYDATNPTPQPDMYIEQDSVVRRQDWLEGNLNVIIKVKTSTDPKYIDPNVESLGQLINSGELTVHLRPYLRTYDSNDTNIIGQVATVALGNADDLNNNTGQYDAAFSSGVGTPFTVGEEITTSDGKRGIITSSDTGATGNIQYVLKSATNFVNTDSITGAVSGATATLATPTTVVAGYGTNIKVMTVDRRFTGGTTSGGPFVIGETVTQTGTGATGFVLEDDGGTIYVQDNTGTFNGTGLLTGGVSGATNTPTATAAFTTVPKDIGGGVGDKNYTAVVSGDITDASARPLSEVYEWWKWLLRKESALIQGGPGSAAGVEGRVYRKLVATFAEVRGQSQYGTKAGDLVLAAQGVFIDTGTLDAGDIRNIKLTDNLGDTYDPPNLQALVFSNLANNVGSAIYRSTGAGLETILRTEFQVGVVGSGNNQAADSTILVAANTRSVSPLPSDVPDSGVLRILDPNDTGDYLRFPYNAVNRTTNIFTLTSGTIGAVTGGVDLTLADNVHVVFIEEVAAGASLTNTIQYVSDIPLFAVARLKGKQPFKTTGTFGSTGANIGANLNNDTVVNLP